VPVVLFQLFLTIFVTGQQFSTFADPNAAPQFNSAILSTFGVTFIVAIFSFILVQGLGTAALTQAVANSYLGKKTGIIESYRQIGSSWVKLLLALFLAGLFGILLFIWLLIPCVGWLTGVGILVFYAAVVVPLIAPVVVLEKQSPAGAIQRVWGLARQRFWWVFGFAFLLIVFNYLVVSGPSALVGLFFGPVAGSQIATNSLSSQFILQNVIQTVVTLLLSLLYLPIQLAGYTLLYFDLRVRLEGFDLALLARETAEGSVFDTVGTIESAPKGDSRFVVTLNEMGYFAAISIGIVVLYFILIFVLAAIFTAMIGSSGF